MQIRKSLLVGYQVDGVPQDAEWDVLTRAFARKFFCALRLPPVSWFKTNAVSFIFSNLGCVLLDLGVTVACGEIKDIFTGLQADRGIVRSFFPVKPTR